MYSEHRSSLACDLSAKSITGESNPSQQLRLNTVLASFPLQQSFRFNQIQSTRLRIRLQQLQQSASSAAICRSQHCLPVAIKSLGCARRTKRGSRAVRPRRRGRSRRDGRVRRGAPSRLESSKGPPHPPRHDPQSAASAGRPIGPEGTHGTAEGLPDRRRQGAPRSLHSPPSRQ